MGSEPQHGAEGQAEPSPETPVHEVMIDYAGNWTIRPVAPRTEPPSAGRKEAQPGLWQRPPTPADPSLGPMLSSHPSGPRLDDLRHAPLPEPRHAERPPNLGSRDAMAEGMNLATGLCSAVGMRNLMRQATQHLAAHNGDVRAAIASLKAAGTAGQASEPRTSKSGGQRSSGQTTEDDAALSEGISTRHTVNFSNDLRLASWAPPAPPAVIPDGPWEPQPGQSPGNYMGPKRASGPRAQCKIVPDENHGGPAGTKAPYWKPYIPGQRVEKYGQDGRPLAPGDEGHPQDDMRRAPPARPSTEPGVSNSPTPDTAPNPYLPPDLNPSLLNDPEL
jgi:hypothetical protein